MTKVERLVRTMTKSNHPRVSREDVMYVKAVEMEEKRREHWLRELQK